MKSGKAIANYTGYTHLIPVLNWCLTIESISVEDSVAAALGEKIESGLIS